MKQNELKHKRNILICSMWSIIGQHSLMELNRKAAELCSQYFPQAGEILLNQFTSVAHSAQEYYYALYDFDSLIDVYKKQ